MKTKLCVWVICLVAFFSVPTVGIAQPYRHLTARDFAGTPTADDTYGAYTYCYVSYSYNPTRHNGNYNIVFNVQLQLNTSRSWIRFDQISSREMLADVLRHEQGHYNIAYLMKNELYSVLSHHSYTSNYQAEIASLFKVIDAKYHKMNADYEAQTQHMTNTRNQQMWNSWFNRQLDNGELADNTTRFSY